MASGATSDVIIRFGTQGTAAKTGAEVGKLRDQMRAMPEQLSKVALALTLTSGALGKFSSGFANGAQKVAQVAAMVAIGGPIGIGLAALTTVLIALDPIMEAWNTETDLAEAAQRRLADAMSKIETRARAQEEELTKLAAAIANFGKSEHAIQQKSLSERIAKREVIIDQIKRDIRLMEGRITIERTLLSDETKVFGVERARAREFNASQREKIAGLEIELQQERANLDIAVRAQARDQSKIALSSRHHALVLDQKAREKAADEAKREAEKRASDEARKADDARKQRIQDRISLLDIEIAEIEREHKYQADRAKAEEEQLKKSEELHRQKMEMIQSLSLTVGSTIGDALGALITGQKSVSEAMRDMAASAINAAVDAAVQLVTIYAVQGAAASAASTAATPIIGPILAVTAAATMGAFIKSLAAGLMRPKGMALGGVVVGGMAGYDSVPILAKPGETYRPPEVERELQRQLSRTDSPSGGVTINLGMAGMASRAETRRWASDVLVPELRLLGVV